MANNSFTLIIVPDAKSHCKRYTFSTSFVWMLGMIGLVVFLGVGIGGSIVWGKYKTLAQRVEQVEMLQKVSVSQKNTLDRYGDDITQLTQNLAHVKYLNSRLMILAGLDPERGEQNLGLGGSEENTLTEEGQNQK